MESIHLFPLMAIFASSIGSTIGTDCTMANFPVKANFDAQKFSGKWYEIKWIIEPWIPVDWNFLDYFQVFKLHGNDYDIDYLGRVSTSHEHCVEGTCALYSTGENAKYIYNRKYNSTSRLNSTYWLIDTDYDHYALAYGCRELAENGTCVQPDCWLWSRTPQIDSNYLQTMENQLPSLCLTTDMLLTTLQQKECTAKRTSAGHMVQSCWMLISSALLWISLKKFWQIWIF